MQSVLARVVRTIGIVTVVAVVGLGYYTGDRGIDFGKHWDEHHQVRGMQNSINSLEMLPQKYVYHGLYSDLGYLHLAPMVIDNLPQLMTELKQSPKAHSLDLRAHPELRVIQTELLAEVSSPAYLLAMRRSFLLVSLSLILWTYLCVSLVTPERRPAAAIAAVVVGTSWEFAYQARYMAVDAPMTAFVGLTLLMCGVVLQARTPLMRLLAVAGAGVAAGLAFGWKLTGLASLVIACLSILLMSDSKAIVDVGLSRLLHILAQWGERIGLGIACVLAFLVTFFITTPGAFLDPFRYLSEYAFARHHYFAQPTPAYAVETQQHHIWLIMQWLLAWTPSPWQWSALFLSAFAFPGVVIAARRQPRFVVLAFAYAVLHVLLTSTSVKLIVRNQLPLLPILAIFIGIGVDGTLTLAWKTAWRPIRAVAIATAALVMGVFIANAVWLVRAADSIVETTPESIADSVVTYMREHPKRRVFVSHLLAQRLGTRARCDGALGATDPGKNARFAFLSLVDAKRGHWKANQPGFSEETFGSLEANYVWYPTWEGKRAHDRVSVVGREAATTLHLNTATFRRCRPNDGGGSPPAPKQ